MAKSVFERYPQLLTLRNLAPDDLVERTVGRWADEFERVSTEARKLIPSVRLCDVFPAELERGAIRLEDFLGHWGNVSVEEVAKIALMAKWLKPKRVLEIGTYNGMTTLQIALNCPPDTTVYTLDLPPGATPAAPLNEIDLVVSQQLRARFGTSTGSYFAGRKDVRIRQLLGDSATFDYSREIDGPCDLIFIDAAHDYENKRIDTEKALSILAPGGVILWHNYNDVVCPDVTRFLGDASAKGLHVKQLRGTMLAVYRDNRPR